MQERASTLRHLLAETDILPMNWEVQAEEVKPSEEPEHRKGKGKGLKKGDIKAAIKELNLLDEADDLLDMPGTSLHLHCLSLLPSLSPSLALAPVADEPNQTVAPTHHSIHVMFFFITPVTSPHVLDALCSLTRRVYRAEHESSR